MSSRTFKLNKIVRDGVYDNMIKLGQKPVLRKLLKDELLKAPKAKILEEVGEFDAKKPKALEELGDILEVVEWQASLLGSSFEEIRQLQLKKRTKVGGFDKGIYIDTLTLDKDDKWADYYASDPKRFPEIGSKK